METFQCIVIQKSIRVKLYTVQQETGVVTAVEQSQANGRAEPQDVAVLKPSLIILLHKRQ